MPNSPNFSVIIATYNWSSALNLALEALTLQTHNHFEALIVGDACTDDSEEVVNSFKDNRFRWYNLPENCGSQWGPNNYGLSKATGEFIAYLGHDDLWWPTHLEIAEKIFKQTDADILAAGTIMYGPPTSGVRAITGFFPNNTYTPRHFFPPSSMLHRRKLLEKVSEWRSPQIAEVAVDYDFILRAYQAGACITSTGEFTTFKFNAAWRRDSYRLREVSEQRAFLNNLKLHGNNFLQAELISVLRASTEDRLIKIEVDLHNHATAKKSAIKNQIFKSSHKYPQASNLTWNDNFIRFQLENQLVGFEWHGIEHNDLWGIYRWSGPAHRSSIILPISIDQKIKTKIQIFSAITESVLKSIKFYINDIETLHKIVETEEGYLLGLIDINNEIIPKHDQAEIRLTLEISNTYRPFDLGINEDRRWLGVAVGWVHLEKNVE